MGSGEVLAETEMRHKQLELADGGSESSSFCPTVRDDALIEVQIELLQCAAFYPALVAFKPRNITLLWLEKKLGAAGRGKLKFKRDFTSEI